jgi:hypothetical protein
VNRRCAICATAELSPTNTTRICAQCRLEASNGDIAGEVFLPIIGFKGWEISNRGRVRDSRTHTIREPDCSGRYPRISLDGRRRAVHTLMAESWLGPRPWGQLVLHANDVADDCAITNLSYGDHVANAADAKRNGRFKTKTGTAPAEEEKP